MSFDKLKSLFATDGEHLGDLVWWALSEAAIERSLLEQKWLGAGLAKSLLPEPPTAEKALKVAVRENQIGQTERLIRLGRETENELIFAVVQETRHLDGSVSYHQEAKVRLDRQSELLTDDNPAHKLVGSIRAAFAQLRTTHTSDDVRRAMLRTLNACAAVSLREHGGIYWIPAPHSADVRKLQQAIEQIGSSKVYLLPVHRSPESERTLGDVAKNSIEDELRALQAEMQAFLTTPVRASTLVKRLDAFEALRTKAQLYRDILNIQVSDLDLQLTSLSQRVESLLVERSAA